MNDKELLSMTTKLMTNKIALPFALNMASPLTVTVCQIKYHRFITLLFKSIKHQIIHHINKKSFRLLWYPLIKRIIAYPDYYN